VELLSVLCCASGIKDAAQTATTPRTDVCIVTLQVRIQSMYRHTTLSRLLVTEMPPQYNVTVSTADNLRCNVQNLLPAAVTSVAGADAVTESYEDG